MLKMLLKILLCLLICTQMLIAQEEDPEARLETETAVQSGVRVESFTKKGVPKKVLYREKVFDYFIESYYQKNYLNIIPDLQVLNTINFYEKYQLTTELGFSYFMNNYMLYADRYSMANYDFESYNWHHSLLQEKYLGSYKIKFETLYDDEDLNTAVSLGRIHPEYTPLTFRKKHNGVMWELFDEETRLILTGSQLKNFKNTKKYLFSSRLETDRLGIGTLGVNYVNSWYDINKLEHQEGSDYYQNREAGGAALYIKVSDATSEDQNGARLQKMKFEVKYSDTAEYVQLDEFSIGSEEEEKYLFDVNGRSFEKDYVRYADFNGYSIYRIILPENVTKIRVSADIAGDYLMEYSFDNQSYKYLKANEGRIESFIYQNVSEEIALIDNIPASTYVYLEISDDNTENGYGGDLYKVEYYEDNQLKTVFSPNDSSDSDESRYLYKDFYSVYKVDNGSGHRFVDGDGYFIYRFPVSAGTKSVKFRLLLKNDFKVRAYLEGEEDQANILHSKGEEKLGLNEGYYEISLDSYDNIYENTYVSKSKKVIGIDYKVRVFDINLYAELDKYIDEQIRANREVQYKDQYAYLLRAEKSFKKAQIKMIGKYFRIDPEYDLDEFVDDNDDQDQFTDELEPFHEEKKYLNYDPNMDIYNYNYNFVEKYDDKPDYTYQWNIADVSYLSYDQQGYDISLEKSKLFNHFDTGLYYFKVDQISQDLNSDKVVYKLKYTNPVPKDSYLDNEYRLEYIKDERALSKNDNNLKNFFKFLYSYWGIKNIYWQFGANQVYFNRHIDLEATDLTTEFLSSLKYTIPIIKDLTVAPMYMIKFYRYSRFAPDYQIFSDLHQHFAGGDINYKFWENFIPYYIYRLVYTDDKKSPSENNFLHIMEMGISHPGKWFFKIGCKYTAQQFIPEVSQDRDWNTFRIFAEARTYF